MQIFESFDEQQTYEFGQQIGREAQPGSVYCLVGNLGTGKTIMAKGLAVGLGIDEDIVSPTFTIVQEYQGRLPFYHFDIYRIMDEDEVFEIGWDEYVKRCKLDGIIVKHFPCEGPDGQCNMFCPQYCWGILIVEGNNVSVQQKSVI